MPDPNIGERANLPPPIIGMPTSVTAFIDFFAEGPTGIPTPIDSFRAFEQTFGSLDPLRKDPRSEASYQVQQFFLNGGNNAIVLRIAPEPSTPLFAAALKSALANLTLPFNLLCIPATANLAPADMHAIMLAAQTFCAAHRAFYIVDIPASKALSTPTAIAAWFASTGLNALPSAAIYYPRLTASSREIPSSGAVAGIYARIDSAQGVWKSPAGPHANLIDATPALTINDVDNGQLTAVGINTIRTFVNQGTLVWGARTTAGATGSNSDFPYVSIRRLAIYIENSIDAGTAWAVFEPNNPTLWAALTSSVSAFLLQLWRQGALQGSHPQEAFFVRCDATTTTQNDIDNGRLNIQIGIAPLRPAEFIILSITRRTAPHP